MSKLARLNPKFKPAFDGVSAARQAVLRLQQQSVSIIEAYLFGSAAVGKNTADSDLDILVVIPQDADLRTYFQACQKPGISDIATDWLFKKQDEFLSEIQNGGISRIAVSEGVKVFPDGA